MAAHRAYLRKLMECWALLCWLMGVPAIVLAWGKYGEKLVKLFSDIPHLLVVGVLPHMETICPRPAPKSTILRFGFSSVLREPSRGPTTCLRQPMSFLSARSAIEPGRQGPRGGGQEPRGGHVRRYLFRATFASEYSRSTSGCAECLWEPVQKFTKRRVVGPCIETRRGGEIPEDLREGHRPARRPRP